jgi:S-adenosylmethionine:tRNA ribosyltransferase-isomerase
VRTDDFSYDLPPELIAQTPAEPRDSSRLLVVHRESQLIEHRRFRDIGDYLRPGDRLVANESRVLPARLYGRKVPSGGHVGVLLLRPHLQPEDEGGEPRVWEALVSPGRRVREGTVLEFGGEGRALLTAEVVARTDSGGRMLRFDTPPRPMLDRLGEMPLPPYIHERLTDQERYQTVYARTEGSAAAPTAGLHFTPRLLEELGGSGIGFATVTLHVGLDTFRPVHTDDPSQHEMHSEWYSLSGEAAEAIYRTRRDGGRIVAVGTTSVRVLETAAREQGISLNTRDAPVGPGEGWTRLFITPGYNFGLVDSMITNFHLPRTTLLMLVSAFAGRELILEAYQEAIRERYRFFSFGDAMLIL